MPDAAYKLASEFQCGWGTTEQLAERIRALCNAEAEAMREAAIKACEDAFSGDVPYEHELDVARLIEKRIGVIPLPAVAEAASPQWRPISTAPKDGTEIDVWLQPPEGEGWRVVDVKHDGDRWVHFSDQWDEDVAVERNGCVITHWQPLPAAPPTPPVEVGA